MENNVIKNDVHPPPKLLSTQKTRVFKMVEEMTKKK